MNSIRLALIVLVVTLAYIPCLAQSDTTQNATASSTTQETRDVAYLKNGSIIRGTILEMIPDSTLRIQTIDGNVFVFSMREVQRITKENVAPPKYQQTAVLSSSVHNPTFALFAGAVIPVGRFGETSGDESGLAKTGLAFGGELEVPMSESMSFLGTVTVALNSVDFPSSPGVDFGQWVTVWPMFGFRLSVPGEQQFSAHGSLQVGLLIGSSPGIAVNVSGTSFNQNSASATAIAFAIGGGFTVVRRLVLDVQYKYGSPEYSVTASQGGATASGKFKQQTGLVQITAGVILN